MQNRFLNYYVYLKLAYNSHFSWTNWRHVRLR